MDSERDSTLLKLENSVNSNIAEKIMGHKNGLDGVYFVPTREQCFTEFLKAIPFLTISNDERMRLENEKLKEEKSELQKVKEDNKEIKAKVKEITDSHKKSSEFTRDNFTEIVVNQNVVIESLQESLFDLAKKFNTLEKKQKK